jgi:hypothetical protein
MNCEYATSRPLLHGLEGQLFSAYRTGGEWFVAGRPLLLTEAGK